MRRKLLITTATLILSACSVTGGTMAVYSAATHTDKTISTSSIGVKLNIDKDTDSVTGIESGIDNNKEIASGKEILQRVSALNTGSRPQYVRVKVDKEWLDNGNAITEKNGKQLDNDYIGINYINTDDWIYIDNTDNKEEGGYVYYKKIVYPGENTTDFMDAYTVLKDTYENTNVYSGLSARVDYEADAIQTVAARAAMLYEWGVVADMDEEGNIVHITQAADELMSDQDNTSENMSDRYDEGDISEIYQKSYETTGYQNAAANGTVITLDSSATHFSVVDKDIEYQNMEPGETREGIVTLYNNSDNVMDYYISSELISNIADAGSGNGLYNIKIYRADKDNGYGLLYAGDIESFKDNTNNILVSEQKLATLSSGDNAVIRISVTLDGRTMDNSYMNKEGRIRIGIRAVQTDNSADKESGVTVKTGDNTRMAVYGVIAIIAGVACAGLIAGMYSRKRNIKNDVK